MNHDCIPQILLVPWNSLKPSLTELFTAYFKWHRDRLATFNDDLLSLSFWLLLLFSFWYHITRGRCYNKQRLSVCIPDAFKIEESFLHTLVVILGKKLTLKQSHSVFSSFCVVLQKNCLRFRPSLYSKRKVY